MEWRKLERELTDILRKEVNIVSEAGDLVVVRGDLILFSITALARELYYRGVR